MPHTTAVVASRSGLHARPAAVFVETAQKFDASIGVAVGGRSPVDAKSILLVMTIGAGHGDTVALSAEGSDAPAALAELVRVVETDHDEPAV